MEEVLVDVVLIIRNQNDKNPILQNLGIERAYLQDCSCIYKNLYKERKESKP